MSCLLGPFLWSFVPFFSHDVKTPYLLFPFSFMVSKRQGQLLGSRQRQRLVSHQVSEVCILCDTSRAAVKSKTTGRFGSAGGGRNGPIKCCRPEQTKTKTWT